MAAQSLNEFASKYEYGILFWAKKAFEMSMRECILISCWKAFGQVLATVDNEKVSHVFLYSFQSQGKNNCEMNARVE